MPCKEKIICRRCSHKLGTKIRFSRYEHSHNCVGFDRKARTKRGKPNTPHYSSFRKKDDPDCGKSYMFFSIDLSLFIIKGSSSSSPMEFAVK